MVDLALTALVFPDFTSLGGQIIQADPALNCGKEDMVWPAVQIVNNNRITDRN